MPLSWLYGVPISGISFPMVTASGTYAKGYDTAQLSGVISKDGGAWAAIGSRISGLPGDGVYTIAALSSTEMTAYTWFIKITANSGCLDQGILGLNGSGRVLYSDISGFAHRLDCSGIDQIYTAVTSAINQVHVDLESTYLAVTSGVNGTLVAVSGLKNDVSGLPGIYSNTSGLAHAIDCSGINGVMVATSALPNAIATIDTTDAASLTSGTLAHTMRLLRWFSWDDLVIDKRYTPNRLYLKTSATATSSYWNLTDDADTTNRTRGG